MIKNLPDESHQSVDFSKIEGWKMLEKNFQLQTTMKKILKFLKQNQ